MDENLKESQVFPILHMPSRYIVSRLPSISALTPTSSSQLANNILNVAMYFRTSKESTW